jgi:photosystem II stability/assembly factor-like uncharacterized protein
MGAATSNGGQSWSVVDLPAGMGQPQQLACGSTSDCVMFGSPVAGCCTATITTTVDGGKSWQLATPPSALYAPEAVACPTATDCYASFEADSNFVIETSTDGGRVWSISASYPDDDSLGAVGCFGPTHCVVLEGTFLGGTGSGGPQGQPAYAENLVSTADGGGMWTTTPTPLGVSSLRDVSCTPSGTCVAVGWAGGNQSAVILSSSDAGLNWQTRTVPAQVEWLEAVVCIPSACVAVGDASGDVEEGVAIVSTDGGVTWMMSPLPAGTPDLTAVTCGSASTCWAGGESTVVLTTDSGSSWQQPPSAPSAYGLSVVHGIGCTAADSCDVVGIAESGARASFFTVDGGTSWKGSQLFGAAVAGIGCSSAGKCFAPGVEGDLSQRGDVWGTIELSNAPGSSWSPEVGDGDLPGAVGATASVACPSSADCLVVTSAGGGSALTEDGGFHWQRLGLALGNGVGCTSLTSCATVGDDGVIEHNDAPFSGASFPVPSGYRLAASDGGIFAFDAPFYGSEGGRHLNKPIVGMATDPATGGYWLVASDGGIFAFDAPFFGSEGGRPLNQPIVAMASTSDGGGYWLLARDGGVFAFGDARFFGSDVGKIKNGMAVGIAPSNGPDGGYIVVATIGFEEFGTIASYCLQGSLPPSVSGVTSSLPRGPYAPTDERCDFSATAYATSARGIVSDLEGATPHGSLNSPPATIVAIAIDPEDPFYPPDQGYWLSDSKGAVFGFDAPQLGSVRGRLKAPIVAIAPG